MSLKPINKQITINATADKVWQVLLSKETYLQWANIFQEGADYLATDNFIQGSKVIFGDGSGNGMVALVSINEPNHKIQFTYTGEIKDGEESSMGEMDGTTETYTLTQDGDGILLELETSMGNQWFEMMNAAWDKAIVIIKELSENCMTKYDMKIAKRDDAIKDKIIFENIKEEKDLDILVQVYNKENYGDKQKNYIHSLWKNKPNNNKKFIVLQVNGVNIGFVASHFSNIVFNGCYFLSELYINPNFRKHGYASILVNEIKIAAKILGYTFLITQTERDNFPAQKLYSKIGFEIIENPHTDHLTYKINL